MAQIDNTITLNSYKEVKEFYRKREECVLAGIYMHLYRVNPREYPHPRRDSHIFKAVDVRTQEEINVPRAILPKKNCTDKDKEEILLLAYHRFDDGEPELKDDGYDEILEKSKEPKPKLEGRVIN